MPIIRKLFPVLALMTFPQTASAQSCTTTVSAVSFGNADVTANSATDTTAELKITCSGYSAGATLLACPALGPGSGGVSAGCRAMLRPLGSEALAFELYSDGGRTEVWGSVAVPQTLVINPSGAGEVSIPIFARVFGGQSTVPVGSYSSTFCGTNVSIRCGLKTGAVTCMSALANTSTASFTGTATVAPQCTLTTTNLQPRTLISGMSARYPIR